ncbi:hypothetical protein EDF81_3400 [Enterobacter sp. BIGb0383]|uniref:hypothetical protein n=1 Tax=unclassified Enterobacter TaxID=2608935 RepID=UPI000F4786CF|nr:MULTISPECIES: hypothetical protein [unclassified Enterobacter]ROP58235.1 hypothetical protein EDF81_3400 [Enterobacter sp. BIGb0383]ROS06877.1 hypothetical protein EC848_3371 [Enterobacter sp. BIGb0359]
MLSFSWFDVATILFLLAAPFVLAGIVIALLVMASRRPRGLIIVKWLVLPQVAALLLLAGMLSYYGVDSNIYFFAAPIMMLSMLFFAIPSKSKPWLAPLLCGHITGLVLFLGLMHYLEPNKMHDLQTGRELHQLRDLRQASKSFIRELDDPEFRQRMLENATRNTDIPEATLKALLDKGATPFGKRGEGYYEQTAFIIALHRDNRPALRLFSELLAGNSPEVVSRREYVQEIGPLSSLVYIYTRPGERQVAEYKAKAQILLAKMPELLDDAAWAKIVKSADPELVKFLWDYHPPENTMQLIQARIILGDLTVVDKIARTPGILDTPAVSEYPATLWLWLVQYAPREIIAAVLDKTRIRWADYQDEKGENKILDAAIDRARSHFGDDPQILMLVMRDMLRKQAAWSPAQVARSFYTEEEGSQVVWALYQAGLTCQQLQAALDNLAAGERFPSGEQRIREICAAGNHQAGE